MKQMILSGNNRARNRYILARRIHFQRVLKVWMYVASCILSVLFGIYLVRFISIIKLNEFDNKMNEIRSDVSVKDDPVADVISVHKAISISTETIDDIIPELETNSTEIDTVVEQPNVIADFENDFATIIDTHNRFPEDFLCAYVGMSNLYIEDTTLQMFDTPDKYYEIDFSTFQPYMDYRKITDKSSPSYKISHDENCYTDDNGLRRSRVSENQFTVNGQDDYVVALGTFYKPKGTAGQRYLIVTSSSMFTIIAGGEKDDVDTDEMNMFSMHGTSKEYGAIIEWIVDVDKLPDIVSKKGTITAIDELSGDIKYIYEIKED